MPLDYDSELAAALAIDQSAFNNEQSSSLATIPDELDPNPDLHSLFLHFNDLFFDGLLAGVEVRWAKRMTLCAGQCHYNTGGYCSVRLSEPLLKFRPRSDMINTLLHEMIHAYFFLTRNIKDRVNHGPDFLKMAKQINEKCGSNITVYHTFKDEVQLYRTHVWQCNGIWKGQPPFFGIVRRANNRKPQKADSWFASHQFTCGGEFIKVSEPDKSTRPPKSVNKLDKGQRQLSFDANILSLIKHDNVMDRELGLETGTKSTKIENIQRTLSFKTEDYKKTKQRKNDEHQSSSTAFEIPTLDTTQQLSKRSKMDSYSSSHLKSTKSKDIEPSVHLDVIVLSSDDENQIESQPSTDSKSKIYIDLT